MHQSNQRPAGTGILASVDQRLAGTDSLVGLLPADTRHNQSCVSQPEASWNSQLTSGQLELITLRRLNQRPGGTGNFASGTLAVLGRLQPAIII